MLTALFFVLQKWLSSRWTDVSWKLNHFWMSTVCKPLQIKTCHQGLFLVLWMRSVLFLCGSRMPGYASLKYKVACLCFTCVVILWDLLPVVEGFPGGSVIKNTPAHAGDAGSISTVRKILWRRQWQPTPVFSPGESHGRRSLATVHGVAKQSDVT